MGVIHLVAPKARLLPLKALSSAGTGYLSDILRAIYYANQNGAKIIIGPHRNCKSQCKRLAHEHLVGL
jgi:subtilisin family serine protease